MSEPKAQRESWSDERVEQWIGNLLRAGVLLSAAVVACGAVVYLVRQGGERPHYHTFHGEPEELRNLTSAFQAALEGHGRGIIQVGLLLLICTPVARVALAAFAFSRQRDWLYVLVSLIVLTLLTISLLGLTP